jgi:hypothetical protein
MIMGIICFSVISMVSILGIAIQLIKLFSGRTSIILLLRRWHSILGYLILLLCKSNSLIIAKGNQFTIILIIDICSIIFVVGWKILSPKMEYKSIEYKHKKDVRAVRSITELDASRNYVVFANYVYDV